MRRGDIVVNRWASPGVNDLHVIIGSTKVGSTSCYETRCLFEGKLVLHTSAFDKNGDALTKIGYVNLDQPIIEAMQQAYELVRE